MKKKTTKKPTKKPVARHKVVKKRKKSAIIKSVKNEMPIIAPPVAPVLIRSAEIRKVDIKKMEKPPLSPYVIEFKNEGIETPIPKVPPQLKKLVTQSTKKSVVDFENVIASDLSKFREENLDNKIINNDWQIKILEKIDSRVLVVADESQQQDPQQLKIQKPIKKKETKQEQTQTNFAPIFKNLFKTLKPAVSFALLALIFILPASALSAYNLLENKKNQLNEKGRTFIASVNQNVSDFLLNRESITTVRKQFSEAKTELENAVGIFDRIIKLIPKTGATYSSGKYLLDAGEHLGGVAEIIIDGFNEFTTSDKPIAVRIAHFEESLRRSYPLLSAAAIELDNVNIKSLPREISRIAEELKTIVHETEKSFKETLKILPELEEFLGLQTPKRYLVIFQNTNEIRPTGGFIGSFALLDIDRGEIKSIEIPGGGSYDLQGSLKKHVIAPEPLQLIEPHWQFHDANWFPDFPTSARKLAWFYEKSGGPTVDGVIAINVDVVPQLLQILGPIEMLEYNRTFSAENFIHETQQIVEFEYDRIENKPKKLIGTLAPKLISKILEAEPEKLINILRTLSDSLQNKDIQLYSEDEKTQTVFKNALWSGDLHNSDGDYFMPVFANIAGGKSNEALDTKIKIKTTIADDGSVIDEATITQTHNGRRGDVFTGIRNVSYLRVYVPRDSELISASGANPPPAELFSPPNFDYVQDEDLNRISKYIGRDKGGTDIYEEMNKTVFGNWIQVDPGDSSTITITYKLPWKLNFDNNGTAGRLRAMFGLPNFTTYSMLLEKQSGIEPTFESEINFPTSFNLKWNTPGDVSRNSFRTSGTIENIFYSALLFEK